MIRLSMTTLLLMVCFASGVMAQDDRANSETQVWKTLLKTPSGSLRLVLDLEKNADGKLTGHLVSLDQNNAKIPVSSATVSDTELVFECKSVDARFTGTIDNEKQQATGTYTQLGREYEITFTKIDKLVVDEYLHSWYGLMEAGGREFEFEIKMFKTMEGTIAKLDSIGEKVFGLPTDLSIVEDTMTFKVPITRAAYEGTLNEAKDTVTGKWKQGGGEFDLILKKTKNAEYKKREKPKRPQTPKPPYPYESVDFNFENKADDVSLSGTLTLPDSEGPFAAAILVSGSGPQDRDETLFGHKPFLVIADHLTRNGIAVLRYDERGVGKSTGNFGSATSVELARDVVAAMDALKQDKRIDPNRIGIIGHSEGGYIAPMIAATRDDVSFIVSLAGPGVSGREISYHQNRSILLMTGGGEKALAQLKPLLDKIIDAVDQDNKEFDKTALEAVTEFLEYVEEPIENKEEVAKALALQMQAFRTPWTKFFVKHDPRGDWKMVKCPVLALNGDKDVQVPADMNLDEIKRALTEGGNEQFKTVKLEGINHLFQPCTNGQVSEYERIETTIDSNVLDIMTDWLKKQVASSEE